MLESLLSVKCSTIFQLSHAVNFADLRSQLSVRERAISQQENKNSQLSVKPHSDPACFLVRKRKSDFRRFQSFLLPRNYSQQPVFILIIIIETVTLSKKTTGTPTSLQPKHYMFNIYFGSTDHERNESCNDIFRGR